MLLSILSLWEPDLPTPPPASGFQMIVHSGGKPQSQSIQTITQRSQSVTVRIGKTRTSAPIKMGGTT